MSERGRRIGEELALTDAQTEELNTAMDQVQRRHEIAKELAKERYGSEDVIFEPFDSADDWTHLGVQSRDSGYWVAAKVWIEEDDVEEKFAETPRQRRLRERIEYHGEGRLEDMNIDLKDPDRFLLVQSEPGGGEPWYVLLSSPEEAAQYLAQDYPEWDFEELIDLDTGEDYNLDTRYVFKPREAK